MKNKIIFVFIALTLNSLNAISYSQAIRFVGSVTKDLDGFELSNSTRYIAISKDGKKVYLASSADDALLVFSRDSSGQLFFSQCFKDGKNGIDGLNGAACVKESPLGDYVYLVGAGDSTLVKFYRDPVSDTLRFFSEIKNGDALYWSPFNTDRLHNMSNPAGISVASDGNQFYVVSGPPDNTLLFLKYGPNPFIPGWSLKQVLYDNSSGIDGLGGPRSVILSQDELNVYVAGTDDDAIAAFSRDKSSGELQFLTHYGGLHGACSIAAAPEGNSLYVACQSGDALCFFERDESGYLVLREGYKNGAGNPPVEGLDGASSTVVSPNGKFVFAAGKNNNAVAVFRRNVSTGELSFLQAVSQSDISQGGLNGLKKITSLTISPDGVNLYTAGQEKNTIAIFQIDNEPPVILGDYHSQTILYGKACQVAAQIQDDMLKSVTLWYRKGGEASFRPLSMAKNSADNNYIAIIAGEQVSERGLQYYFIAEDGAANISSSDTCSVKVTFGDGVQYKTIAAGEKDKDYQMFSSPNELSIKDLSDILEPVFGEKDKKSWRCFQYKNGAYFEYPNVLPLEPGRAFWIISKKGHMIKFGGGTSLDPGSPANLILSPGWNQIGNPFAFPISWSSIMASNHDTSAIDGPYIKKAGSTTYAPADAIAPFAGYFIKNKESYQISLKIPPVEADQSALSKSLSPAKDTTGFYLQLIVASRETEDSFNYIGVSPNSRSEWDQLDHCEPPPLPIEGSLSLYFPHHDWLKYPDDYTTDFRPLISNGEIWEAEVTTSLRVMVTVTVAPIDRVPQDFEVWLVDPTLDYSVNLREHIEYSFAASGKNYPKPLKVLIGNHEFVRSNISIAQTVPCTYELSQNFPNPFNPATTIRYSIPCQERVTLSIFNTVGEKVRTLIEDEQVAPGTHLVVWDGRNDHGLLAASGVFFCRIHAGNYTAIKKMILVK
jgi:DNA-binding beta-propeller fold protein YncE